jgi:preprotein translocase subunit SecG
VEQIILVVHLVIALAIIGLIMLQQGKGADMGASFGAGASQTLFGSTGTTNVLTKSTAWLVAAFFATSFGLAVFADNKTANVDDLGFEIPVEASLDMSGAEQTVNTADLPMVEMPAPTAESDMPVLESPAETEAASMADQSSDSAEG